MEVQILNINQDRLYYVHYYICLSNIYLKISFMQNLH